MSRPDLTNVWHFAYCHWYDADRAGRHVVARAWGSVADGLVRAFDRFRLWGH